MIVCAGHAAYDLGFALDQFPQENQKYHVGSILESSGGPAANAASLLARWGVPTSLLAPLGQDPYGEALLDDLQADGVVTTGIHRDPQYPTPLSVVVTNALNGSRTILTRRPARPPLTLPPDAFAVAPEGLLFDGHEPELSLQLMNRYPDAWSVLDAGSLRPGTETLARRVDYLVASETFTDALVTRLGLSGPDAGLTALRSLNPGWVGYTRGENGCVWYDPATRQKGTLPALSVEAVDTTGAGDLFHGAFVYGLRLSADPVLALQWGSVAAGLSVKKCGGRASIPSLAEVAAVLATRPCLPTLTMLD